jgi:hypothetical protein
MVNPSVSLIIQSQDFHIIRTTSRISAYKDFCITLQSTTSPKLLSSLPLIMGHWYNLSPQKFVKLILHECCSHKNMMAINNWIQHCYFPFDPAIANASDPVCIACQYGKAHWKPHKKDTGSISAKHTKSGAGVSADQLEVGSPGKLPAARGLPTNKCYKYCNIWVDHHSRYIFPTFHETKDASKLVLSTKEFQPFAMCYNMKIQSIRVDTCAYTSTYFKTSCEEESQKLTFCAVGGHWQNGI